MKINTEATQADVARLIGVDVSTVNKILNRKSGPKFRKSTVHSVFKAARQIGYDYATRARKGRLERERSDFQKALKELIGGVEADPVALAALNASMGPDKVARIVTLYR